MMNQITTVLGKASTTKTKLSTPQLLKGGLYLTWGASLLLLVATITGVQGQRHAIKTIGKDSVPSIVTAQRIKDALAGMDANAANELIAPPGRNPDAVKGYEERRQKLSERLVAAAENITYGDAERKPIQTLQLAVGEYIAKLQQARDFHQRGDTKAVLVAYRSAAEIMDKTLLPAAQALDQVNLEELNKTYARQRTASSLSLVFVLGSGLLLIGVLVAIQLFLKQRMRRTLNPMLLGATAIAILFLGYTAWAFLSASHNLKVAKKDAFMSMHALRQARALGYSMNADESRYLLDKERAAIYEQNFLDKAALLATLPENQNYVAVFAAASQEKKVEGFTGYLADELNNITFPDEKAPAMVTLYMFGDYLNRDQEIRELEQTGQHQQAVTLCTGYHEGQSNAAFNDFLQANQKTYDVNQQVFDQSIEQGFKDVDGFEFVTPVVVIAIALLTLFGLQPRLKEYL